MAVCDRREMSTLGALNIDRCSDWETYTIDATELIAVGVG